MPRRRQLACHAMPVVVSMVLGAFLILLFGDRDPVQVSPIDVEPNVVAAGGVSYVTFSGRANQDCDGIVHRWIESNEQIFDLTDTSIFRYGSDQGRVTFRKEFKVPGGMMSGPAVYHSMAVRWCNPIQHFLWPIREYYAARFMVK